jgi:hypothetical protein
LLMENDVVMRVRKGKVKELKIVQMRMICGYG